jgi:hypothetical protein
VGLPRCVTSRTITTISATARIPSSTHTQVGVLLVDFSEEVVVCGTITRCVVVCATVVVDCAVVVDCTVVVTGVVVVFVSVVVVVVSVWALPLAGASVTASRAPATKNTASDEALTARGTAQV